MPVRLQIPPPKSSQLASTARGLAVLVFDDSFEHEVRVAGGDDAPPRAVAIFHVAHPQLIARNHSKSNAAVVARRMRDAAAEVCEHDSGPPE